ncbi:hypothetical protein [uncultured Sneathiella sp.]|uniref:hypothetical protein n=1 Tax=uncultured Sneathiella sp. TaxID=879315 RepID=UPI0030ED502E|tara:strand:- start:6214 stop:7992 length:1779 start_codon:yes stop_codon:yes gene_type:complete
MSNNKSTHKLKAVEVGASSIFIFLAILLSVSRVPFPSFIFPIHIVTITTVAVVLIFLATGGRKAATISIAALAVFFAIVTAWAFLTNPFYSPGDDDYGYHILAVWELAEGWDPFQTPHDNIWLDSYPTGIYVLESYMVSLTGLLLSGRSVIIGLAVTVGFLAFSFYNDRIAPQVPYFKYICALLFAGIVVANPVVLTQLTTHYVDTPLYLMGCALVFFLLSDAFTSNRLARWSVISCIILLVNTKTAALYYVPLIVISGFVVDLILNSSKTDFFSKAFHWIGTKGIPYVVAFAFGILVIGYKPFVTNYLDHGEFLYPSVDEIMQGNVPKNVIPLSSPMKFIYGIGAETGQTTWPFYFHAPIDLKVPGTFKLAEFKLLRYDTRRGGFGPLFSLALLASIIAYASSRIAGYNKSRYNWHREGDGIAVLSLFLLIISMFFPESWWARYVPFVWLSAILFATSSLYLSGKGALLIFSRVMFGITLISFLGCIVAGLGGAARANYKTYKKTKIIKTMENAPLVEIYPEIDPRITTDFQSKTITSAGDVWGRLLQERGVNVRVYNGVGNNRDDREQYCQDSLWFDADVMWCIPRHPVK